MHEDEIVFLKKLETKKIFGQPFNVKLEIYKREFCSFLVFLQEEFQKKNWTNYKVKVKMWAEVVILADSLISNLLQSLRQCALLSCLIIMQIKFISKDKNDNVIV